MSLKEELGEWTVLKALKAACESELRSLSPYHRRIIVSVNKIYEQQVKKNLVDGGHQPRDVGNVIDPEDCFHIGDVIYHLQCTGMSLEAAIQMLQSATKMTNASIAMGEKFEQEK